MRMNSDELGARMKGYEAVTQQRLAPTLPICARIDGRRFSRFTRGFRRPFDPDLSRAMRDACAFLVEHTHARIGYVQSDEISLVWQASEEGSSVFFDGRVQKMCSVLAALATTKFSMVLSETHPAEVAQRLPVFDARVWQVPSQVEAANVLLWRAMDARKNAVSALCRAHFSAKAMHGKRRRDMLTMLATVGVSFDDLLPEDRFGVFYRREVREVEMPEADWLAIPEKHRPPSRMVARSVVAAQPWGYFGDVADRVAAIFT